MIDDIISDKLYIYKLKYLKNIDQKYIFKNLS